MIVLSLSDARIGALEYDWVGGANYGKLIKSHLFRTTVVNTFFITAVALTIALPLARRATAFLTVGGWPRYVLDSA